MEDTPVKAFSSQGRVLVSTAWVTVGFGYRLALHCTADEWVVPICAFSGGRREREPLEECPG